MLGQGSNASLTCGRGHVSDQNSAIKRQTFTPYHLRPVLLITLATPVRSTIIDDADFAVVEALRQSQDQLLDLCAVAVQLALDVLDLI